MGVVRVGITGAYGFLGWHTSCRFLALGIEVSRFGRAELATANSSDFEGLDAICHCAGVNRGDDESVRTGNIEAARLLMQRIRETSRPPQRLVYANSTQSGSDSPYGESKAQAGNELREFCLAQGIIYVEVLIPNVFGESGRPFYNSFVATFCHQLAGGESCTVVEDRKVTLVHAQKVAHALTDAALSSLNSFATEGIQGTSVAVGAVLEKLEDLRNTYLSGIFPELADSTDVELFNTLRSYLFAKNGPVIPFLKRTDPRGWLVETVKSKGGGQVFVSSTEPGITRGQHFHLRKVERFVVLQGTAEIKMRRLFETEVTTYPVSGDDPCAVDIPTLHTHSITNVGEDQLITLFWTNELFDPEDSDTYPLLMENGADLACESGANV